MEWLSGKKTYILAVVAGVVVALRGLKSAGLPCMQAIPEDVFTYVLTLLGVGGVATIRAAIGKAE
jgi:hypothetical protein